MKRDTWIGVPNPQNTAIDYWALPLPGVRGLRPAICVHCSVPRGRVTPVWFGTCTTYGVVDVRLKARSVTDAQVEFLEWLERIHHARGQLLRRMRERLHGKEAP